MNFDKFQEKVLSFCGEMLKKTLRDKVKDGSSKYANEGKRVCVYVYVCVFVLACAQVHMYSYLWRSEYR